MDSLENENGNGFAGIDGLEVTADPYIDPARRAKIIRRNGDGVSKIRVAEVQNADDLAFAIRFAMDHRLYKMSKSGGVTDAKVADVIQALGAAAVSFMEEHQPKAELEHPISKLGQGDVMNPYSFIGK